MKKLLFILVVLLAVPVTVFAQEDRRQAIYFYADWCSHCQKVNAYFQKEGFYEKYDIRKLNFDEPANKILLQKVYTATGGDGGGIPAILVDNTLLVGDEPIIKNFQRLVDESEGSAVEFLDKVAKGEGVEVVAFAEPLEKVPSTEANKEAKGVSFPLLLGAALSDAINPCAFAVLILLVGTVLKGQGKRRALWAGLAFSLAIFVSYFAMGLGLYKAITVFNAPKYISLFVGGLAILIGLANLKDAFWYGKFFVMEVPVSWRPKMQTILRHVTSPVGALLSGFLVSLFLLPCSSGPYVVIVGLLAQKVDVAIATGQLLLYNFIFILPMLAITLGMYFFDIQMGSLEKIRRENLRMLHAVVGTIMFLMGIYLVQGWI
ncbi:MAG TPA: cytochrome c biogenesis protein CcdA [Candidatus Moranbacteria bacterium]|nr:cytochrome c biogenesis protein CcdA [Candidatus Moranbacteria bacterium]